LAAGQAEEAYVDAFLSAFGGARGKPVLFTDKLNEPLLIDEGFFRRPDGSTKLGSSTRKAALGLLAEAIREPDEIWWSWEKIHIGRDRSQAEYRLRRRFVARFQVEGRDVPMVVVFDVGKDGWKGVTGFRAKETEYLENIRGGVLAYRRPE